MSEVDFDVGADFGGDVADPYADASEAAHFNENDYGADDWTGDLDDGWDGGEGELDTLDALDPLHPQFGENLVEGLREVMRSTIEPEVDAVFEQRMADLGLSPDGSPLEQWPPEVQEVIDYQAGEQLLTSQVEALAQEPGFEFLATVDSRAVIERAREIAPQVIGLLGPSDLAVQLVLAGAGMHVAHQERGEMMANAEIAMLGAAYGGISVQEWAHAREAAERAFAYTGDSRQALRLGFEEATGRNLSHATDRERITYYGIQARAIQEQRIAETRAAAQHEAKPGPAAILTDSELVAKYGKAATDHKIATGRMRP